MSRLSRFSLRATRALVLGLAVAGSASAQPADGSPDSRLGARLGHLAERLDLTDAQTRALAAVASRHADDASLWTAAAEVRGVLTDAQLAQLRRARADRDGQPRRQRTARRGRRGALDRAVRPMRRVRPASGRRADLTDAQRQSLETLRDDVRARRQSLVQQLRDGQIDDPAFADQATALRQDAARRMAAVRPSAPERLAQQTARREAAATAREQALGLTDDQRARLLALRLDGVRPSPERPDLRPFLDADGRLDRAAFRQATQARRQEQRAASDARREQMEAVLTPAQRDLMTVRAALAGGGRGRRVRRGGLR